MTRMNMESLTLSEISQTQSYKDHVIRVTCRIWQNMATRVWDFQKSQYSSEIFHLVYLQLTVKLDSKQERNSGVISDSFYWSETWKFSLSGFLVFHTNIGSALWSRWRKCILCLHGSLNNLMKEGDQGKSSGKTERGKKCIC